ncbi:MAG TPA: hypothetical protein VGM18_21540 [Candidatus Sulfotelmatobacter sp.]|jgi:hypothetical protein
MSDRGLILAAALLLAPIAAAQSPSSSSKAGKPVKRETADSILDDGAVINGVYHNKSLALTCKIPEAWVLRTDEMNAREDEREEESKEKEKNPEDAQQPASSAGAKVLLAAFSRPPDAKGEDINSSILIAAENASAYPGLKEAAQYFGPLTEVAQARGFTQDEDPYEIALGAKTLVRVDFHKDVGSRVMHQSTLAMLSHGYAISITLIAGTEDEVEELIDGLTFTAPAK